MPIAGPALSTSVTLVNLLDVGLKSKPDEAALVLLDRTWTWRELDEDATRLAKQYLAMGLAPGDRVASLLPNRGELIVHYLACCKAGLVATPLNYRYQTPEIDHALEVSEASLIVAHAERDDVLAASSFVPRLRLGRVTFADGHDLLAAPRGGTKNSNAHGRLEELMTTDVADVALPAPPPTAPIFIFFTSGSTGKPKGVTHTHETFGWMAASAVAGLGITPSDVFMPATSASHIACSSLSFAGLAAGACIALARSFGPDELLPLLRRARPTLLCSLPVPLFGVSRDPGARREDFQSIRRCVSGGDKISAELEHEYTAIAGHAIEELYGMTETGTSTFNPSGAGNRIGSIGQVAPGFTASVRDEVGSEIASETTGRLWMRSGRLLEPAGCHCRDDCGRLARYG
jgi:acyl-coenzyme A synthetase/AMP-(fatty) acid ligase